MVNLGFNPNLGCEHLKCHLLSAAFYCPHWIKKADLFMSYQRYFWVILCKLARKCSCLHSGLIYALAFIAILFLSENTN